MNTKTILITGARSFVALDLARVFYQAGFRVICADSLKSGPCRFSSCVARYYRTAAPAFAYQEYIWDIKAIIENERVDFLVPTCEEIFYISKAKEDLNTTVFSEDFELLELLHNKWKFYQLLCKLNLSTPETHLWNPKIEREGKWVQKPIFSRFAASICIVKENHSKYTPSPENPLIEQAFVQGEKLCSYSICHQGKIVAHGVYRVLHSMGIGSAICFKTVSDSEVDEFVASVADHLNFTGQIAFDFIRQEKLYCLECNPRGTSGIHLFQRNSELASCFFGENDGILHPEKSKIFHDHLFMLWYGIKQKEVYCRKFWHSFFKGKNPLWSMGDNRVIACMPLMLFEACKLTLLQGKSFHEALSEDLEYNGEVL